jgi:hypothetical protein
MDGKKGSVLTFATYTEMTMASNYSPGFMRFYFIMSRYHFSAVCYAATAWEFFFSSHSLALSHCFRVTLQLSLSFLSFHTLILMRRRHSLSHRAKYMHTLVIRKKIKDTYTHTCVNILKLKETDAHKRQKKHFFSSFLSEAKEGIKI